MPFLAAINCRESQLPASKNYSDPETWTREKGRTMKLTTTTQVSVDGVMQAPGAKSGEGERDVFEGRVFEHRGWAHFDNEAGTVMDEIFQRADAFLFGRRT